jgi:hypothetical protein
LSQLALAVAVAVALTGASVEPWSWSSADHGIPKHLYFTLRLAQMLALVHDRSNWIAWVAVVQIGTVVAVLAYPSSSSETEPCVFPEEEERTLESTGLLAAEPDVANLEEPECVETDENLYTQSEGKGKLAQMDPGEAERYFATDLSNRVP